MEDERSFENKANSWQQDTLFKVTFSELVGLKLIFELRRKENIDDAVVSIIMCM